MGSAEEKAMNSFQHTPVSPVIPVGPVGPVACKELENWCRWWHNYAHAGRLLSSGKESTKLKIDFCTHLFYRWPQLIPWTLQQMESSDDAEG